MTGTIERIEREIGIPGLADLLAERLSPTDLQSLLLEVYRVQAQKRSPAAVLAVYESDRFVRPSSVAPERLAEWERVCFESLPTGIEAIGLWHGLFDFVTASAVDQGTVAAVMSVLVMAWTLSIVIDKLRAESFQRKVCRLAACFAGHPGASSLSTPR